MILPEEIERVVGTEDLPAMPMVAQKVMAMVGDEHTTPADLQRVIAADPALAAHILKVANSALFGRARAFSTLSQAILSLGYSTVRSLVIASSARSLYLGRGGTHGLKEQMMWEHALGCGIAARLLASRLCHPGVESAFIGGLLHDIGEVVLNARLGEIYARVFAEIYNEQRPGIEVEVQLLGITHTEVGLMVAQRWQLSPELGDIIAHHHAPEEAAVYPDGAAIVSLADLVCTRLGLGLRRNEAIDLARAESAGRLGLSGGEVEEWALAVGQSFDEEKMLFEP